MQGHNGKSSVIPSGKEEREEKGMGSMDIQKQIIAGNSRNRFDVLSDITNELVDN